LDISSIQALDIERARCLQDNDELGLSRLQHWHVANGPAAAVPPIRALPAPHHVWMAPGWQEIMLRVAQ
jgi:hypothetical protein